METKKNAALVYNTLNGQYLEYRDNTKISRLIRRLNSDSNLYVIKLEGKEMDESVSHFIEELRAAFCGDIINTAHRPHKPRQLKPMINLHTSFETREGAWEKENLLAKDEIGDYLNILTLYLNEKCVQNCTLCGKADKQFQWCRSGKRGNMLSLEDIQAVMAQINTARLTRVHISGGNWFEYPELPELTALLGTIKADKFYVSHYLNLPDAQSCNILDMLKTRNNKMEISVHFPLDIKALEASLQWTGEIPARYRFAVESEAHLKQLENLASRYAFDDIIISPYYNGTNASFFESSVYSSREDIIEDRPTMKEILARQV
ncbi:MAG: hypothetical protein GY765_09805, partial [bacterium]|nr:hypothetical protein [bacterium]